MKRSGYNFILIIDIKLLLLQAGQYLTGLILAYIPHGIHIKFNFLLINKFTNHGDGIDHKLLLKHIELTALMQIIIQLLNSFLISTAPQQHPIAHRTQQPLTRHLQITLLLQQRHKHITIQVPLTLLITPEHLLDLPTSQSLKDLHDYGDRHWVRTQVLLFHLQEELERVVELLVLTQSVQHNIKVNLVQILLWTLVITLVYQNCLLVLADLKQPLDVGRIRNHILIRYPFENSLRHLEVPRLQCTLQTGVQEL